MNEYNVYASLRIPERYANVEPNPKLAEKLISEHKGILYMGSVGTGKTYALVSLMKGLYDFTRDSLLLMRFRTLGTILREVRESINTNSYNDYYEGIRTDESILIIDDLGTENITQFTKEFLYNIVNDYYNACKVILATTNCSIAELKDSLGERTVSRLIEMSNLVELKGKDRRLSI